MYYIIDGDLYETIGSKFIVKCIASTRENMEGIFIYNPDLTKAIAFNNKKEALQSMHYDAYYSNQKVYEWG